ncbi:MULTISPECIES: hypothetical protein [Tsukamurella]|uniref:Uncharacterized protein n=2 Tax=Tsukamurella TaxID=2060 RepID=A0A5C5RXK4_9ACTN|nr:MULTISPECIES: hypothetical protein [Tsukamurella]NMD56608.1 hypothetical protein [Tsukamurella columbiensis]TWS27462.1 hypothetical protein FK530_18245 [Tsukamurella conjunctivitidis]
MIGLGTHVVIDVGAGRRVGCRVAAIRHAPFSYVELEPLDGGARRTMPLRVVEALLLAQGPSTPRSA